MEKPLNFTKSIPSIARQMLLDQGYRDRILKEQISLSSNNTRYNDVNNWVNSLRIAPKDEIFEKLWLAATKGRPSSWQSLIRMLGPHLLAVRKLMVRIIDEMPGDSLYANAVATIVRKGAASVTRTPSSVLWCFALMQSQRGEITSEIYPLAAACAFYYQGVVLFDDIADGELGPYCSGWPPGQAAHIAYSMAGALPLICIEHLKCTDMIKQKIAQSFAQAMWLTNYGQFLDITGHSVLMPSIDEVEKISHYKSGVGNAHLTRAVACFLNLDDKTTAGWANVTEVFWVARQIASDAFDLWRKIPSTDLASGKFTWPLACAANSMPEAEKLRAFQELVFRCQYDIDAQEELHELLDRMGILGQVQSRLFELKQEGLHLLNQLGVTPPAKRWLLTWASQADIFGDVS